MPESCLYFGRVMHHRYSPAVHRFEYRTMSLYVDIDRLDALSRRSRLFSYNRFNLFSFHDRDHGPRDGSPLRGWVDRVVGECGIRLDDGPVMLLCFPRFLGYVFNPLSIYFCHNASGDLSAIVYEVKNTFGEQHCYVVKTGATNTVRRVMVHSAAKKFYVSPFMDMDAHYDFRIKAPDARLGVVIRHQAADGVAMLATQRGRRQSFTDRSFVRALFAFPFISQKVIGAIHWEAARLWLKGVKVRRHRASAARGITEARSA
ncbi:MAG: DUF1365 domain-containing protein [Minwuiales bacterium]|nr:DUF1365 domain-containing protein [Minwuiales bacterium]